MSAREEQARLGEERAAPAKRRYQKPRIEDYGTVVELTGTGEGTASDGDPFNGSGAVG